MDYNILFGTFLAMLVYWKARNLFYEHLAMGYRHRFFKLRDQLRMAAITGEIDPDSKAFDFLDRVLSNGVAHVDTFNIFTITYIQRTQWDVMEKRAQSLHAMMKSQPVAERILADFQRDLVGYFISKHYFISAASRIGIGFRSVRRKYIEQKRKVSELFLASTVGNNIGSSAVAVC